jgi:hypothetical protein
MFARRKDWRRISALLQKSADGRSAPLPRAALSRDLADGDAERGVAVRHGDANLELCDRAVEGKTLRRHLFKADAEPP